MSIGSLTFLAWFRLRLVADPRFVRMIRGRRHKHSPRFDVQKHENEQIAKPFRRQHFEREEIALPELGRVNLEKLVPRAGPAIGAGVESSFPQDVQMFLTVFRETERMFNLRNSPTMRVYPRPFAWP